MSQRATIEEHETRSVLCFVCPGCELRHGVNVRLKNSASGPLWSWNGSLKAPTLQPSILVTYDGPDASKDGAPPARCHSYVTDGRIQFLGDCTHGKAGQTLDLPELEEEPA